MSKLERFIRQGWLRLLPKRIRNCRLFVSFYLWAYLPTALAAVSVVSDVCRALWLVIQSSVCFAAALLSIALYPLWVMYFLPKRTKQKNGSTRYKFGKTYALDRSPSTKTGATQ